MLYIQYKIYVTIYLYDANIIFCLIKEFYIYIAVLSSSKKQLENSLGQKMESLEITIMKLTSEISTLHKTLRDKKKSESINVVSDKKLFSLDPHANNYYLPVDEDFNPTNINFSSAPNENNDFEMEMITENGIITDQVPKETNKNTKKNNSKQLLSSKETNISAQKDVIISQTKTEVEENTKVKCKTVDILGQF